jgi:hypothetical protein
LLAGLLLILAGVYSCSEPLTVEQQVIVAIRQMEEKVENGERRAFMNFVAEDFDGQYGQFDHQRLNAFMIVQLRRHERAQAQIFPILVTSGEEQSSDGRTAVATFRALITGGPGWVPDRGRLLEFTTGWRETGGEWLLVSAHWKDVMPDEVFD